MDFKTSGYEAVVEQYKGCDIPVLLTEYGCNAQRPRTFPEVKSIYGPDMDGIFSGGFMYMFSEEANGYGLVDVTYGNPNYEKTSDYDNFKKALTATNPQGTTKDNYDPQNKASTCPNKSDTLPIDSDSLPPTPDEGNHANFKLDSTSKSPSSSGNSDAVGGGSSNSNDKAGSKAKSNSDDSSGATALLASTIAATAAHILQVLNRLDF